MKRIRKNAYSDPEIVWDNDDEPKAREIIMTAFGGRTNFMTPTPIEYGFICDGKYAYELSEGSSAFNVSTIFGVTVVDVNTMERQSELSTGVFTRIEYARNYLNGIKNMKKFIFTHPSNGNTSEIMAHDIEDALSYVRRYKVKSFVLIEASDLREIE